MWYAGYGFGPYGFGYGLGGYGGWGLWWQIKNKKL